LVDVSERPPGAATRENLGVLAGKKSVPDEEAHRRRSRTLDTVPELEIAEDHSMSTPARSEKTLIEKIRKLPAHRVAEVEDFVDFLRSREDGDPALGRAVAKLSEDSFATVWDNPEDADYDRL